MQHMSASRHTYEKDRIHSKSMTGRIAIRHNATGNIKRINPELLETYACLGYHKCATVVTSLSKKVSIRGKDYATMSSAARDLNISVNMLSYRIKSKHRRWAEWHFIQSI